MKILVTGGAGFIGSYVTRQLLDKDHEVVVYDDLSRGFKKLVDQRATFIQGPVLDKNELTKALKGVDAVVHMAAFIIVPESVEKPHLYWENNVVGTETLLEAMREATVNKIIFSSSATVYGDPDKLPLTESSPVKKATNPYGQTKIEMEKLIEAEHKKRGLSAIILRYFNPYGPNELHQPETHAIPNFIKATLAKKPIPLYWKGGQIRDFIYVEDLAAAHIAPLSLEGSHIFNVGTGEGTKVIDIVNKIFENVGYKVPIQDLGDRPGDVPANYTSAEKIQKELGWKAKVSLEEGLKRTVEFFKNLK
ncbi:MAG: UDP-glucose 4-epimerase GalE [Candidatus Woykebacteria bacterium GWB1_45_5]|uniref:UDP-glucose 4-epimerase n=2 Tax=Candidatus Woykeibacteriota TaxID=1817899 RepID=A0A1G1W287_9BACT|nr:MAG: UDP-glucose 4-epimerase GalE [Candidatus Woykebacteria bacterium GWA1_44_8]OGY22199.1 MAG: UDP-glucose 4-epimerase GalE [Candidatus Woykebacteria bacterium GWB1_45_5]